MTEAAEERTDEAESVMLTAEELDLWRAWGQARNRSVAAIDEAMSRLSGLRMREFAVLNIAGQSGGTARIVDLSLMIGLSSSRVSRIVDLLSARGLCERTIDAGDGRASLVALTPLGHQTWHDSAPHQAEIARRFLIRHIPRDARAQVLEVLTAVAAEAGLDPSRPD